MTEPRYAWVVVGAAFMSMAVIFGVAYSFAAFFEFFSAEFEASRADVSLVFGLCGLIYFTFGAVGGILADRFGPRAVCSAGMLCIAGGLFATSLAQSIATVYLTYGVGVGIGIALVYTPSIACVQPWFTQRRGLAAGIASAGVGAGTLAVPLLVAAMVSAMPWRDTLRVLALGVLIAGLSATFLLRRAPMVMGATPGVAAGASLRQALHSRSFWWLYLATVTAAPSMFIPFAHASAAARDLGIDEARAVGLVGMIGMGSVIGRFVIGGLADRIGRILTLVLLQVSMGASLMLWSLSTGYTGLALFALWFGLSYGGIVSVLPAICMDIFGARAVSAIIGTLYTGAALGNLLGPVVAGAVFDASRHYGPVIWGCLVLSAVATLASARLLWLKPQTYA